MVEHSHLKQASDPVDKWVGEAEEFARSEPTKAVVSAFAAGFLINLVPIGAIVGVLTEFLFAVARPALLFLGLLKTLELCRTKNKPNN